MNNTSYGRQMNSTAFFDESEICLLELTDSGTILYWRNTPLFNRKNPAEFVGRNLFEEIAPFENTEELRRRLNYFVKSKEAKQKFTFDCRINNKVIPTKIMLVRVFNQSGGKQDKTVIVDIRKI